VKAKQKQKRAVKVPLDYVEALVGSVLAAAHTNTLSYIQDGKPDEAEKWAKRARDAGIFVLQTVRDFADYSMKSCIDYAETHRDRCARTGKSLAQLDSNLRLAMVTENGGKRAASPASRPSDSASHSRRERSPPRRHRARSRSRARSPSAPRSHSSSAPASSSSSSSATEICRNFNSRRGCQYERCKYRHVCEHCKKTGDHIRPDCPEN
jgi:hypothetical protein